MVFIEKLMELKKVKYDEENFEYIASECLKERDILDYRPFMGAKFFVQSC